MAKHRTRHRSAHRRRRRRAHNPSLHMAPRRHRRRVVYVSRRRRSRNPRASLRGVGIQRWVTGGLWATAGAIFARALPGYVASSYNNGVVGYGLNFGSALAAAFLASFFGPDAAFAAGIGGVSATFLRMIQDYGGGNIPGVSGDIDHMGYFVTGDMAIPAEDSGRFLPSGRPRLSIVGSPAAAVVSPAGATVAVAPAAGAKSGQAAAASASPAASPAAQVGAALSSGGSWRGGGRWS